MRILNGMATQQNFRAKGGRSSEDTGERRPKKASAASSKGDQSGAGKVAEPTNQNSKGKGKGKASETENGEGKSKKGEKEKVPGIMPHESLAEYNRRIESILRPGVSAAIKSANHRKKDMEKEAQRAKEDRKRRAKEAEEAEGEAEEEGGAAAGGKGKKRKHDVSDPALEFASAPTTRRLNDIAEAPPQLPTLRVAKEKDKKKASVWAAKGAGKSGLSPAQERILAEERERVIKRYREIKAGKEAEREKEREREAKGKPRPRKSE